MSCLLNKTFIILDARKPLSMNILNSKESDNQKNSIKFAHKHRF